MHAVTHSLLALTLAVAFAPAQDKQPPHIVLIFCDDLGWTDLSTGRTNLGNGSPYHKTPQLDALAAAGTCFTSAYSNAPNCAPTRAALWSGQWAPRTGVYTVGSGNRGKAQHRKLIAAENNKVLAASCVTLAETLQSAGYTTGHFGKWHLGKASDNTDPNSQGFDHSAGGNQRGGVGKMGNFADESGAFQLPGLDANGVSRQFLADRLTDEAVKWMASTQQPMFCCISHYSVHTPIQAPEQDIEAAGAPPAESRHRHRRYAGMLRNLDQAVGRVVQFLNTHPDPVRPDQMLIDNTVVLFTSDNGGLGGYRDAGIAGGQEITNQLPLRSGKGSLHEGGIRVPLIVRWDDHVRAGATDDTPVQSIDLYPTLAHLAGASLPQDHSLDGMDFSGRLQMQPVAAPDRTLFWHFPGYLEANARRGTWRTTPCSVARDGDLKVMFWYETGTWSLFDLGTDIGEQHDLAAERTAERNRLAGTLIEWLQSTQAPMPNDLAGNPVALPQPPE